MSFRTPFKSRCKGTSNTNTPSKASTTSSSATLTPTVTPVLSLNPASRQTSPIIPHDSPYAIKREIRRKQLNPQAHGVAQPVPVHSSEPAPTQDAAGISQSTAPPPASATPTSNGNGARYYQKREIRRKKLWPVDRDLQAKVVLPSSDSRLELDSASDVNPHVQSQLIYAAKHSQVALELQLSSRQRQQEQEQAHANTNTSPPNPNTTAWSSSSNKNKKPTLRNPSTPTPTSPKAESTIAELIDIPRVRLSSGWVNRNGYATGYAVGGGNWTRWVDVKGERDPFYDSDARVSVGQAELELEEGEREREKNEMILKWLDGQRV